MALLRTSLPSPLADLVGAAVEGEPRLRRPPHQAGWLAPRPPRSHGWGPGTSGVAEAAGLEDHMLVEREGLRADSAARQGRGPPQDLERMADRAVAPRNVKRRAEDRAQALPRPYICRGGLDLSRGELPRLPDHARDLEA